MTTDSGLTHVVDIDNNDGSFTSDYSFITMTNAAANADLHKVTVGSTITIEELDN